MRVERRSATVPATGIRKASRTCCGSSGRSAGRPRRRTDRRDRMRDRRHEPAAVRSADGQSARGWRARRLLHAGPDEEESAGHARHRRSRRPIGDSTHRHPLPDSTTIGVRYEEMSASVLASEVRSVETPLGPIRFKVARRNGDELNAAPEFDDCAKRAAERGCAIKTVQACRHQGPPRPRR